MHQVILDGVLAELNAEFAELNGISRDFPAKLPALSICFIKLESQSAPSNGREAKQLAKCESAPFNEFIRLAMWVAK